MRRMGVAHPPSQRPAQSIGRKIGRLVASGSGGRRLGNDGDASAFKPRKSPHGGFLIGPVVVGGVADWYTLRLTILFIDMLYHFNGVIYTPTEAQNHTATNRLIHTANS